jgi:hypothetical protein
MSQAYACCGVGPASAGVGLRSTAEAVGMVADFETLGTETDTTDPGDQTPVSGTSIQGEIPPRARGSRPCPRRDARSILSTARAGSRIPAYMVVCADPSKTESSIDGTGPRRAFAQPVRVRRQAAPRPPSSSQPRLTSLNRTQEVGGSNPPSSLASKPLQWGKSHCGERFEPAADSPHFRH